MVIATGVLGELGSLGISGRLLCRMYILCMRVVIITQERSISFVTVTMLLELWLCFTVLRFVNYRIFEDHFDIRVENQGEDFAWLSLLFLILGIACIPL